MNIKLYLSQAFKWVRAFLFEDIPTSPPIDHDAIHQEYLQMRREQSGAADRSRQMYERRDEILREHDAANGTNTLAAARARDAARRPELEGE